MKILMKILRNALVLLALTSVSVALATRVSADTHNKKTVMTFSQPVEIPGQVLPAGTYVFKLESSLSNRHIVQVWDADGMKIIATVLAINDYRLQPTGQTVVKFRETPADAPEALKAWFFPGDNFGQEFVYPKTRAVELAVAEKEPVPSAENTEDATPIVAETPEREEVPVEKAIETEPQVAQEEAPAATEAPTPTPAKELPHTGSSIPLIALLGGFSLGAGLLLKRLASSKA
jgi:LPXTG-motif cell wall-anchored protein